jgi:hypothetical protein
MTSKIDNSLINTGATSKGGNIEYLEYAKSYLNQLKKVHQYKPVEE